MSKILQLKGKNFLGLPFFDKKVFPITKPEAVIADDGSNMKQVSDKVSTLDTEINDTTNGISKKVTDLSTDVATLKGSVELVPERFVEEGVIALSKDFIENNFCKYLICNETLNRITIKDGNYVEQYAPFMLQFIVKDNVDVNIEDSKYIITDNSATSLTTGIYLLTIQYGVIRVECLTANI